MAEGERQRFVVRDGPPTFVVWDEHFDKQVNFWPYPDQHDAAKLAEQLNQTHSNDMRPY